MKFATPYALSGLKAGPGLQAGRPMRYALEGVFEIFASPELRDFDGRDLNPLLRGARIHAAPGRPFADEKLTESGQRHLAPLAQSLRHLGFKSNENIFHLLFLQVMAFSDLGSKFRTIHSLDRYHFDKRSHLHCSTGLRVDVEHRTVDLGWPLFGNDVLEGHGRQLVVKH